MKRLIQSQPGMAGPGGAPTKRHVRPPVLAGATIVLVAGFAIVMISAFDHRSGSGLPAPVAGVAVLPVEAGPDTVEVYATSNVRAAPEATAEIVAIVPGGRPAEAIGRTADGQWVRVAYPAGSTIRGWLPASRVVIDREALDRLPADAPLPSAPAVTAETAAPTADALPDLTISDVFLLQDGRLAIDIRNVGGGGLINTEVPTIGITLLLRTVMRMLAIPSSAAGSSSNAITPRSLAMSGLTTKVRRLFAVSSSSTPSALTSITTDARRCTYSSSSVVSS